MDPNSEVEVNALRKQKTELFRTWPGYSGSKVIGEETPPVIEIFENTETPFTPEERSKIISALAPAAVRFSPKGPIRAY